MNRNKRVTVTGGAGFVGSHLIARLVEKGYAVTVIDDLSTGKLENIQGFIDNGGEQTRDFTFVKDIAQATVLAAESNARGVFNIAGGEKTTIKYLAGLIIRLVGSKVEPTYQEARPGDIKHSLADISRATSFGYKPEYSLESGLRETIRWFHEQ